MLKSSIFPFKDLFIMGLVIALLMFGTIIIMRQFYDPKTLPKSSSSQEGEILSSNTPDKVVVDFGIIWATAKPIDFKIPLKRLDTDSTHILNAKSSCGCTVVHLPKANQDEQVINIRFDPRGKYGQIHEYVALVPKDSLKTIKKIIICGEIIPGWYARPLNIEILEIKPAEQRNFKCELRVEHDLPKIVINRAEAIPHNPDLKCSASIGADSQSVVINGIVKGKALRGSYNGHLEVEIGPEPIQYVKIPLKISFTGTVWSAPEIVTIQMRKKDFVEVRCLHFAAKPLNIKRIEAPSFLLVEKVSAAEKCILKIGPSEKGFSKPHPSIIRTEVKIYFEGVDIPLNIPVLCID